MPFDALTLACVADELKEKVVGGRIQGVFLPAPLSIGLEIYANRNSYFLFASAHPQHARVHLTGGKITRASDDVTPLLLLLRKYVRDGRLAGVEQPALERTLSLIITKADVLDKGESDACHADAHAVYTDDGAELTTVTLIIEVMGRYSNIILTDSSGSVLEAVKHIPAEINRYRVTLPRHPYVTPPPQNKADPRGVSAGALAPLLQATPEQMAWQCLVQAYRGISPLLAREVVFRAAGASDTLCSAVAAEALAGALSTLLSARTTHLWLPGIARRNDDILDYAPYQLTQFGALFSPTPGISAAVHAYYEQETFASDYAGTKQEVQKALAVQRGRVLRRQESLHTQQAIGAEAEHLRVKGEMLLAYATQIVRGQREAVIDTLPGEPPLRIQLDPLLSPVENAQSYFKRYTQARDAARSVPQLLQDVALDLAYLDQLQLDLDLAATAGEVREVRRALADAGKPPVEEPAQPQRGKKRPAGKPAGGQSARPLTYQSGDGMEILVGRNARQNDYVTFELASSLDLWLHARGVAGSHVIVRCGQRVVSPQTLAKAAAIAAGHSTARTSASVPVDYVQRRYVHRARGGGPGLVTYTGEKTIHVRPAPAGQK